jgi:hypothetical protein
MVSGEGCFRAICYFSLQGRRQWREQISPKPDCNIIIQKKKSVTTVKTIRFVDIWMRFRVGSTKQDNEASGSIKFW